MRLIHLPEVKVSANHSNRPKSALYSNPSASITQEDLAAKSSLPSLRFLLSTMPGVYASGNVISVRGSQNPPLLIVDDVITSLDQLDIINPYEVAQIDLLKDAANTAIFGMQGADGVISIITKKGKSNQPLSPLFHIQTIMPLGYQIPMEFYAPKYDTSEIQHDQTPDLRTTIHWLPDVRTDSMGAASFSFYTADDESPYTMTIEGLTDDGKIISAFIFIAQRIQSACR